MPAPKCPKCGSTIPSEDVNVATDVAYCRSCNLFNSLSAMLDGAELDDGVDIHHPPQGAWHTSGARGTVIGVSHRSVGTAVTMLGISLFWNGIVSVFVLVALASTLRLIGIGQPSWFPAPKMNGDTMGIGMTIFLWLFLTPFIAIGTGMLIGLLMSLAGRTEIQIQGKDGSIFTGVGPIGWRRRFDPSTVKAVRITDKRWRDSDGDAQRKTYILLETREGKEFKLGSMLPEERRKFMVSALRQALLH